MRPAARLPALVTATVVVSAVLSAFLVYHASAQPSEPSEPADPLELYDANDNGVIDADEAIQAVSDYLAGRIDRDLALRVWELYRSTGGDAEDEYAVGQVCPWLSGPGNLSLTSTHDQIDASWDLVVNNSYPAWVVSYEAEAKDPDENKITKTTGSLSASFTGLTESTTYTVSVTTILTGLPPHDDVCEGGKSSETIATKKTPDPDPDPDPEPEPTPVPDKPGSVSLSTTYLRVGTSLTATLTDGDGGVTNLTWKWSNSDGEISGATSSSYTAASGDAGKTLTANAIYDDAHGTGKSATSPPTSAVGPAVTTANACTVFDDNGNGKIDRDEVISAIDEYLYGGLISQAAVTKVIECYNTDNPPGQVDTPNLTSANGALTATWVKPSGPEPTSYEVQHKLSTASWPAGSGTDNGTSLKRTISGLAAGPYDVRVRACNGAGCGDWSSSARITVTVTPPATPTPTPTATPTPTLPSVGIVLDATGAATVTEGTPVRLKLTSNPAPKAPLTVKIEVSEIGSFIDRDFYPDGEPPSEIIILKDTASAPLVIVTDDDDIDEAVGTITVVVKPGAGYNVANPALDRESVTVEDNDLPIPPKPDISRPISVSDDSATVEWSHRSGIAAYLFQYRRADGIGWRSFNVEVTSPDAIGYVATTRGLECETRHRFRVRAWGDGITYRETWGPYSDVEYATTDDCAPVSPAPTPTPTPPPGPVEYAPLVEPPAPSIICRDVPGIHDRVPHLGPWLISADGRHVGAGRALYDHVRWLRPEPFTVSRPGSSRSPPLVRTASPGAGSSTRQSES